MHDKPEHYSRTPVVPTLTSYPEMEMLSKPLNDIRGLLETISNRLDTENRDKTLGDVQAFSVLSAVVCITICGTIV